VVVKARRVKMKCLIVLAGVTDPEGMEGMRELFLEEKKGPQGLYVAAGAMLGPSPSALPRSSLVNGLLA
jgi:hypothetical protein